MTISYSWLSTYLPITLDPDKLSRILTSIGLEVESIEKRESIPGGLAGLTIGQVLTCARHPDADKLSITTVSLGTGDPLQIVCGAPNVAAGQKVVVATVGATIYPTTGEPLTMKKVKIRGVESHGMICAEDEIGLGSSHAGILVLPDDTRVGQPASEYFKPETDYVFEIGLTPNRMDAMSHLGVARDVCAWLVHHEKLNLPVKSPLSQPAFKIDDPEGAHIQVTIENPQACQRYAGLTIRGIQVAESPEWLRNRLLAIGQRPINNIVDITNFILHETGQPLHAFDAQQIGGQAIRVKNLTAGTPFVSLDEKERSLHAEDLMICDAEDTPLCIGGVFGGLHSGVSASTTDVFLESAWFHPVSIRKSSVRHGLRTDAAARFEKGVDISQTVQVLKRAASLIKEVAGGTIAGALIDIYPNPEAKKEVALKYHFLKKLSGKNYHPDAVKKILGSLGFTFIKEGADDLWFDVPYHKPDIHHPADLVEEIMRIDGLDNVEIPAAIHMSPAADVLAPEENWQQKVSEWLAANGFNEIFTNSITNSKYYSEAVLATAVKMLNNLSADLDIMRPSMLETGLETVAHNLNRRNRNLCLFELGKTYSTTAVGSYQEQKWLTLLVTGDVRSAGWRSSAVQADFFFVKGVVLRLLELMGIAVNLQEGWQSDQLQGAQLYQGKTLVATVAQVKQATLRRMDIKQPVWYAELPWQVLVPLAANRRIAYREIPKFPNVERDLALVVGKQVSWQQMQQLVGRAKAPALERVALFDVFESDKLGADKKSMALNFRFQHAEKTLTDAEIDGDMQKIASLLEKELQAEVRK